MSGLKRLGEACKQKMAERNTYTIQNPMQTQDHMIMFRNPCNKQIKPNNSNKLEQKNDKQSSLPQEVLYPRTLPRQYPGLPLANSCANSEWPAAMATSLACCPFELPRLAGLRRCSAAKLPCKIPIFLAEQQLQQKFFCNVGSVALQAMGTKPLSLLPSCVLLEKDSELTVQCRSQLRAKRPRHQYRTSLWTRTILYAVLLH